MAASSISMLALLLLMPAVTPGFSTEDKGSLDDSATVLNAMKHQQSQSSDALTDLHMLLATVLRVEERINQLDGKFDSLKKKIEDKSKVEAFTKEIDNLKNQLHNKNHMVGDLQRLLNDKTSEKERIETKAQNLSKSLDESRRYAANLQLLLQLNNTLESKKEDVPVCAEKPQQKITNLVLQYSVSRDWPTLKRGLEAVMDQSSEAYGQLRKMSGNSAKPQYDITFQGYTQLVTLLLCAGMPVNWASDDVITLLHGAAAGGHYELAKMLVSRGADVNVSNSYSQTPLIWAAYKGYLDIVKLLVQAGADTTTKEKGHNALYFAIKQEHIAVQRYLEQFPV